jgi:hypothetical protein
MPDMERFRLIRLHGRHVELGAPNDKGKSG